MNSWLYEQGTSHLQEARLITSNYLASFILIFKEIWKCFLNNLGNIFVQLTLKYRVKTIDFMENILCKNYFH